MKKIFSSALFVVLAACAAKPAQVAPVAEADAPVWRYRLKTQPDGSRIAVAVGVRPGLEIEEVLPQGLWCPHGALIDLERDGTGMVVGAVSKAEEIEVKAGENEAAHWFNVRDGGWSSSFQACGVIDVKKVHKDFSVLPAFALAPAENQKEPRIVLRWQISEQQTNWAILERRTEGNRVTQMGPWQIEHIQFQRMERPGPGLENAVLLTFQAGEGSQHAVVKVVAGEKGAKLRPLSEQDAQVLRHFLGRATPAEKVVVGKVLREK